MKSFKQFMLSEAGDIPSDADEIVEAIKRDCAFFLKESKLPQTGLGLYRGLTGALNNKAPLQKIDVRVRKPLNSSPVVHEALDSYLDDYFGFPFRSLGTFAAPGRTIAASYGWPCLIFPIGNFKYCWSPDIVDAYVYFQGEEFDEPEGLRNIIDVTHYKNASEEDFNDPSPMWGSVITSYLEKVNPYKNSGMAKAISDFHENEIMLGCKSYYAIGDDKLQREVLKKLKQ